MSLVRDSQLRMLLIEGKIDDFNRQAEEEAPNLESTDLRGTDLRGANLLHANLRNAYLRNADLRGVDLFHADLEGASIQSARLSGTRFPLNLPAAEISISCHLGVRMRAERS